MIQTPYRINPQTLFILREKIRRLDELCHDAQRCNGARDMLGYRLIDAQELIDGLNRIADRIERGD